MDEFNELMNNGNLTEEQVILCRNTRRRGKNKVNMDKALLFQRNTITKFKYIQSLLNFPRSLFRLQPKIVDEENLD